MSSQSEIFRSVLDNLDVIAWAVDNNGIILLSEGKQLRHLGLKPGQVVGANVFELYRDNTQLAAEIRRALAGEEFVSTVGVQDRVIENRYAPLRDEKGAVVGAAGVGIDITESVQAKREIDRQAAAVREQAELLDLAYDAILVRGLDGTITYYNRGAERMYGYSTAEAVGQVSHALLKTTFPKDLAEIQADFIANDRWQGELTHVRQGGSPIVVESRWVLKRDARGEPASVLEINTDITAKKEAEEAFARRQEELIRAQSLAIAELSTPLIPITDEILVMPLIGVMDSNRAKQVMESLLHGLSTSRGQFAILDITGVSVVDTQVANALIRAAHAARLLGAEVILTGIRPEVAQTLVSLDTDISGVTTRSTLQSGIAFALGRRPMHAR